jgi:hypothetical protein
MRKLVCFSIFLFSLTFLFGCSSNKNVGNESSKVPVEEKTAPANGSPKIPQGITVNNISFEEVGEDSLPPNMSRSINNLKANRGYILYSYKGYYYIALFSGQKSTGGYGIKVISIEDNEGKTNIIVQETAPPQGAIVTQVITYPYTVVKAGGITPNITVKTTQGETLEKLLNEGEMH